MALSRITSYNVCYTKLLRIERSQKSLKEKLSDILKIHTQIAVDFNKMKLLVHNQDALDPEHKEQIKEKQRSYTNSLIKILDELKADGKMIDLNTKASYNFV